MGLVPEYYLRVELSSEAWNLLRQAFCKLRRGFTKKIWSGSSKDILLGRVISNKVLFPSKSTSRMSLLIFERRISVWGISSSWKDFETWVGRGWSIFHPYWGLSLAGCFRNCMVVLDSFVFLYRHLPPVKSLGYSCSLASIHKCILSLVIIHP